MYVITLSGQNYYIIRQQVYYIIRRCYYIIRQLLQYRGRHILWDCEHNTTLYQGLSVGTYVPRPALLGPVPNHWYSAVLYVPVPRTNDTALCRDVCKTSTRRSDMVRCVWHVSVLCLMLTFVIPES